MKIYIIQIDMGSGFVEIWENADIAYCTLERAEQQLAWMQEHYGIAAHQLRIETLELEGLVKDRKTGEYYDPKAKFDELMNTPEVMASLNRLKIR
jgi:hypothetical protein